VAGYDAQTFHDELIARGLLVPSGVRGIYGRSAGFEDVLTRVDAMVQRSAKNDRAESMQFPPVINRDVIERAGYMESFPHLCGVVHAFSGAEPDARALAHRIDEKQPWGDLMEMTDIALAPAVCYPFYPTCAGVLPEGGRHVTLQGWVFRHEPSLEPTRMQSFRMREYVRVGAPDVVIAWRDMWLARGIAILQSLELPAHAAVAADPFFGKGGRMLAAGQRDQRLKFEVLVPVISQEEPTACASFNYHQEKFGLAFGIRTIDGEIAHSACMGFGMERVVMALFKTHGFEPKSWPSHVRALLWP
jgi:seryl-tRNA synthetase